MQIDLTEILRLIRAGIERNNEIINAISASDYLRSIGAMDIAEARGEALDAIETALMSGTLEWLKIMASKPVPDGEPMATFCSRGNGGSNHGRELESRSGQGVRNQQNTKTVRAAESNAVPDVYCDLPGFCRIWPR